MSSDTRLLNAIKVLQEEACCGCWTYSKNENRLVRITNNPTARQDMQKLIDLCNKMLP